MANRGGYVPTPRAAEAAATVAGNLRRIRLGMGWSLDGAARHLGVKVATLGAHERGSRAMTVDQVHRYAAGYEVATEALFAGTPQMTPWYAEPATPATATAAHVLDDARAFGRLSAS